jgi:hypothetical protein
VGCATDYHGGTTHDAIQGDIPTDHDHIALHKGIFFDLDVPTKDHQVTGQRFIAF